MGLRFEPKNKKIGPTYGPEGSAHWVQSPKWDNGRREQDLITTGRWHEYTIVTQYNAPLSHSTMHHCHTVQYTIVTQYNASMLLAVRAWLHIGSIQRLFTFPVNWSNTIWREGEGGREGGREAEGGRDGR